jgi:hypothetical protein
MKGCHHAATAASRTCSITATARRALAAFYGAGAGGGGEDLVDLLVALLQAQLQTIAAVAGLAEVATTLVGRVCRILTRLALRSVRDGATRGGSNAIARLAPLVAPDLRLDAGVRHAADVEWALRWRSEVAGGGGADPGADRDRS